MSTNENNFETTHWDSEQVRRQSREVPRRSAETSRRSAETAETPERPVRKKRRKRRRNRFGWLIYLAAVLLVSSLLAGIGWLLANDVCALNKDPLTASVPINDGDGVEEVTEKLKDAGLIEYKFPFKIFAKVFHAEDRIQAGVYELNTDMDYRCLIDSMHNTSGVAATVDITIPEGYTNEQIFELLAKNSVSNVNSLREAAKNFQFTDFPFVDNEHLGDAARLEGYLFPDTYNFYVNESAVSALSRMMRNFQSKLTDEIISDIEESGMSIRDVVIIASLIEGEAGPNDDKTNFSSVIFNRLNAGWKLQLDATLNYIKGTSTFKLTNEDMEIDSPYNTYLYGGLPVGPIGNPGIGAIEATLHPAKTNYWYWYSDGSKTSFFETLGARDAFAAKHPYN